MADSNGTDYCLVSVCLVRYSTGKYVKPLMIQKKSYAKAPMHLQCMLMPLQKYDEIVHVPGKDVHTADALLRASAGPREQGTEFDTVN